MVRDRPYHETALELLPDVAVGTLIVALVMTVGIGLAGTWRILGQKAAPILRQAGVIVNLRRLTLAINSL